MGERPAGGITAPAKVVVAAGGTSLLEVGAPKDAAPGPVRLDLAYTIANVKVEPDKGLAFTVAVDVEVLPARK